jgi:hypothetical protein
MIDLLLGQFAPYLILLGGLAAAFFGIKSKFQSSTIKKQDNVIATQKQNEAQLAQAVESQKQTIELTERSNEILNSRNDVDASVKRLRERAKSNRDSEKD